MNGPILFTERLILRTPIADDLDGWAAFDGDAEQMTHLGGAKTRAEAWRSLCQMAGAWSIRGFAMFSLIERESGAWVGRVGPWQPEGWPGTEVGWGVLRAFEGRGFALEAASASMDYAVDVLGWSDIIHTIAPANSRSQALAERLGSVNRGRVPLPAPHSDTLVEAWGQSADDWRRRRSTGI